MTIRDRSPREGAVIEYTWTELALPAGAPNLALASSGVRATASTATYEPAGAINGNHTLAGWGHGNGWQAAPTQKHPNWWGDWLELDFPQSCVIDTVIVYTVPEHVAGRNKLGVSDYQLQVRDAGTWETVQAVRDNTAGVIAHQFAERRVRGLRLVITATNTGDEVDAKAQPVDLARILEVEAYHLGPVNLWRQVKRRVDLTPCDGPRIAIFKDAIPAVPHSAPSSPDSLADLCRAAGYGVTFLDGRDLTAHDVLSARNFDVFVHPYGPPFPLGSVLYDYLSAGGHLLALGGYAFTEALQWEHGRWQATGFDPGITCSVVRHEDYFTQLSEQLGLFGAPGHTLRDVAYISTAPGQLIVRRDIHRSGEVTGPSAVAVVGDTPSLEEGAQSVRDGRWEPYVQKVRAGLSRGKALRGWFTETNNPLLSRPVSRWIPLVAAYDRYGRVRGTVGAALLHHDGVYRNSRWVYFGVDTVDLFAPGEDDMRAALLEAVAFLLEGVTLHTLQSDVDCYYSGEPVVVSAIVDNAARHTRTVEVTFAVTPVGDGHVVFEHREAMTLGPGQWRTVAATWQPPRFDDDLYRVEGALWVDGVRYDCAETGFVAWQETVVTSGPSVTFADNYFTRDGERRFLLGTRGDGVHIHGQAKENALWWDREYRMMRDYGQDMTSPVNVSQYVEGLAWGHAGAELIPDTLLRAIDAQVQLAQKHGLIYGLCLFFVGEDEALWLPERSRALCAAFGQRYKDVPGILFYIFDDGFREDPDQFNAWARECMTGLNASSRRYIVTAEWSAPMSAADVHRDAMRELDVMSLSCYHGPAENPAALRMMEMRAIGKGFSNAEFGRQASAGRPVEQHAYLVQPHLHFGMGHALVLNWKWKDNDHAIFPWGIVFPGDWTPKDELYTFRNSALLFRQFRPLDAPPPVVVLLPRAHLDQDYMRVFPYLLDLLGWLIRLGMDYTVIDEADLDKLPAATCAVLYPLPHCAPEAVFPLLRQYVEGGGMVWMSGSDAALTDDTPNGAALRHMIGAAPDGWLGPQPDHLAGLSLSRALLRQSITPTGVLDGLRPHDGQPCVRVRPEEATIAAVDAGGNPVVLLRADGAGRVVYSTDVTMGGAQATLPAFLALAGVAHHEPDTLGALIFTRPVTEGTVYTITTDVWDQAPRTVTVSAGGRGVRLALGPQGVGLIAINHEGAICAVEGLGVTRDDGAPMFDASAHVILSAVGAAGLQEATGLMLLPIEPGIVRLRTDRLLAATAGDVVAGRWVTREVLDVQRGDGWITLTADPTCARSLILLSTPEQYEEHVRWIETLMAR